MSKNIRYFLPFSINQLVTLAVLVVRKSGHLHQLPAIEAGIKSHTLALIFPHLDWLTKFSASSGFSRVRYQARETTARRIFVNFMSVTLVVTSKRSDSVETILVKTLFHRIQKASIMNDLNVIDQF